MQEHVELEVALEIIMAQIALKISELSVEKETQKKETLEKELKDMMRLQEEAYKGNREVIRKILAES